jgi:hypothetical protein
VKKLITIATLLCGLMLSGCAAQIAEADASACESYGAYPGTKAYFMCRMIKDNQRRVALRHVGDNLIGIGTSMMNENNSYNVHVW